MNSKSNSAILLHIAIQMRLVASESVTLNLSPLSRNTANGFSFVMMKLQPAKWVKKMLIPALLGGVVGFAASMAALGFGYASVTTTDQLLA